VKLPVRFGWLMIRILNQPRFTPFQSAKSLTHPFFMGRINKANVALKRSKTCLLKNRFGNMMKPQAGKEFL
jgi:hypothetical protein